MAAGLAVALAATVTIAAEAAGTASAAVRVKAAADSARARRGKNAPKPTRPLKELERGEGFRIDKYVVAEKKSHKPVKTEYRLTREGLKQTMVFQRLIEAKEAADRRAARSQSPKWKKIVETGAEGAEVENRNGRNCRRERAGRKRAGA